MNLIREVPGNFGNPSAKFNLVTVTINSEKLNSLINYCNKCYFEKLAKDNL